MSVGARQAGQLGCAQAGLRGEQDQCVVAAPDPGRSVGSREQRCDLGFGEVADQRAVKALGWDRENALDAGGVFWVAQRGKTKQRMDRCEPGVARPRAVVAVALEVVKERGDQPGVEVADVQRRRLLSCLAFNEAQEQAHRVAVAGDGVRADLALADEMLGEERLQRGSQSAHRRASRCCSRRSPANAISSGAADKYQYVAAGSICPR